MDKDRRTGIAAAAELRSGADAPRVESGDSRSSAALFHSLYTELHRLTQSQLRRGSGVSLSATTLLHEAYLDLSARDADRYPDRAHFMAYAVDAMRGIVIDYARNRHPLKRGGAFHSTTIDTRIADEVAAEVANAGELARIGDALDELAKVDPGLTELVDDNERGGEATQLTRDAGRVLTPEFAALERLLRHPVTIATDVYALGGPSLSSDRRPAPGGRRRRNPASATRRWTRSPRISGATARTSR